MTAKSLALGFLGVSAPLLALACVVGGPWMEVVFIVLAAAWPVALILVGVEPRGGLGALRWILTVLFALLATSLLALFALRGQTGDEARWLGLPLASAIEIYGLLVLPLPWVALGYAWTFDRAGLSSDDLAELRRRFGDAS